MIITIFNFKSFPNFLVYCTLVNTQHVQEIILAKILLLFLKNVGYKAGDAKT